MRDICVYCILMHFRGRALYYYDAHADECGHWPMNRRHFFPNKFEKNPRLDNNNEKTQGSKMCFLRILTINFKGAKEFLNGLTLK